MPLCSSEKMSSGSLLRLFFVFFDRLNAGVVNIQYANSCINVHCCSTNILCCGIGSYNSGRCFCAAEFTHLAGYRHFIVWIVRFPTIVKNSQRPKTARWLLIQAQATPSHVVQGQFQRNHTNHGSILFPSESSAKLSLWNVLFSHHGLISGLGYITMRNMMFFLPHKSESHRGEKNYVVKQWRGSFYGEKLHQLERCKCHVWQA